MAGEAEVGQPRTQLSSGKLRGSQRSTSPTPHPILLNADKPSGYISNIMSHSHDHGHDHSHAAADHGHTHEILTGPGSYLAREPPIVEGRKWEERAFTVGIGGCDLIFFEPKGDNAVADFKF